MARCFCSCHTHPGAYPPPCGVCGHDDRQGSFPGPLHEGWEPRLRFEHDVIISNQRVRLDRLSRQRDRLRKALACIEDNMRHGSDACPYCGESLQHRSECPFAPLAETDE